MTSFPKPERTIDPEYLAWLRGQACAACYAPPPCDPHHTTSRGAGGGDDRAIPLCRPCHSDLEANAGQFKAWSRERLRGWCGSKVIAYRLLYSGRIRGDGGCPF